MPRCGSENVTWLANAKVWKCKSVHPKQKFSAKVGTVFEDSATGLEKWLPAMWMAANCKNSISSYKLHRALGVTQNAAWFMLQRIRLAMQRGLSGGKMRGVVEADETYIGAKARFIHKNRRTGVVNAGMAKTPIQGILEHAGGTKPPRVTLEVAKTTRRPELCGNVRENVETEATVCTDALMSYDDLSRDYDRQIIDHFECYAKGEVHTNGLESFLLPSQART